MIFNLLARAFKQKIPGYTSYSPVAPEDPLLCARCSRSHDEHHPHGACPLPDGSGFSLNSNFRRIGRVTPLTECDLSILEEKVDLLEEISDETGKLAADLKEIGEA